MKLKSSRKSSGTFDNRAKICSKSPSVVTGSEKTNTIEPLPYTSVVSKYSLNRVLTHEFLHFDTRTRSYSSSLRKTSNGWGEF